MERHVTRIFHSFIGYISGYVFSAKFFPIGAKNEFKVAAIDLGVECRTPFDIIHCGVEDLQLREDASFTAFQSLFVFPYASWITIIL